MLNKLRKATKGFTLIELLVVIAIIGLLASIVLVSLTTAREKARDSRRLGDLRQVQLALELFFDDDNSYSQQALALRGTVDDYTTGLTADLVPTYMGSVPVDPLNNTPNEYRYAAGTSTGAACTGTLTCTKYLLGATLEDASHQAYDNDIDGATPAGWTAGDGLDCVDAGSATDTPYCVGS